MNQPQIPASTNTTAIQPYRTREDMERFLKHSIKLACDPTMELKDLAKTLNDYNSADSAHKEAARAKLDEKTMASLMTLGIESHAPLAESVAPRYRSLAIETANQLIQEFKCETHSERALAQVAAGSYVRFMAFSKVLDQVTDIDFFSPQKNGYYAMIGREVDRAERRFRSAAMALKQIKSPAMNFQLKVGTAFVAQNQQINASPKSNPDTHEIIVAK